MDTSELILKVKNCKDFTDKEKNEIIKALISYSYSSIDTYPIDARIIKSPNKKTEYV